MPRESRRLGGDTCGCIISGANTSMPMLTMVPLKSGAATPTTVSGWPLRIDRLADDRRIGGKRSAPQRVADDGDRMLSRRHIVRRQQRAAELRADAKRLEVVADDELRDHALGVDAAPEARETPSSTPSGRSNDCCCAAMSR